MNALWAVLFCLMLLPTDNVDAALRKGKKQKNHSIHLIQPKPGTKQCQSKPAEGDTLSHIILDPGHGAEDEGAKSQTKPFYSEKNFNLVTARFVQQQLKQKGFTPILTRDKDLFVSLADRALIPQLCNRDIFVSIHFNSAPSSLAEGVEVFYYRDENHPARTQTSKALAEAVLKRIIKETGAKSRGVKHGNYYVIRETDVPAILIEGGFLTHPEELAKIKDPAYLKKLAWGITQGIEDYLQARKAK